MGAAFARHWTRIAVTLVPLAFAHVLWVVPSKTPLPKGNCYKRKGQPWIVFSMRL